MRVLVIGNKEREAAQKLVEFASKPENHYVPGPEVKWVPGDHPEYVLHLGDYRCVFTITEDHGLWRHLSISVPARGKLPHFAATEEIAHLFGITGTVREWAEAGHVSPHESENCIVIVQEGS